ncbi:MAG: GatB/YqeY domain-containing protein [Gemmatimonadaceae bacterium]
MSALADRLQSDLNSARKAQNKSGVLLLSTILSDVKNKKIELRRDPTDEDVIDVLRKGIKRRRESVEMYDKGGRADLADKERAEAAGLEEYLPAQVSEDDIRAAVRAAIVGGATSMGPLMGRVNPEFKGRTDGSVISRIAKEELAAAQP